MVWGVGFVTNSILLGVGLAMDAFSVSLANGLNEPKMKAKKVCQIAGMFAFFQALMPIVGWFCVHNLARIFKGFQGMIPWIALILLLFIGGKMLWEGMHPGQDEEEVQSTLGLSALVVQGIATSIDALSVGFTISDYNWIMAVVCALLIAMVTFFICVTGVVIGKRFGTKLASKASILGGIILIAIGIEIFVSGMF
ncbi:MAG: manganese efflux pump [Lachnospiraceae bacterium]|nr:manganese efflux pump [Lachnospiraceae bacterium]